MELKKKKYSSSFNPKVSVIIPVYKVEKYLRECLESVVSQTLRDIEIICVNDCTPDNSQQILDEYGTQDNRFVLIKHDQNKGLSSARNTGLAHAKGDFIFFLDADDFLACNDALEILYNSAITDDAEEVIGGIVYWDEYTDEKRLGWHENYLKQQVHGQPLINLPQLWANVVACNKLLRRTFLDDYSIRFNENIRKHEDNPFSVQVHILARKISIIIKTTYIYRQTQTESIMNTEKKSDSFQRCMYCYDIFNFIESDKTRHKFRKMYYPMYSKQLIESAMILSRFSPSEEEKMKLLGQWAKIVNLNLDNLPEIPRKQRKIFKYLKKEELQKAWKESLDFGQQNERKCSMDVISNDGTFSSVNISPANSHDTEQLRQKLARLEDLNKRLYRQIERIHNTYSWRITGPFRRLLSKLRNY